MTPPRTFVCDQCGANYHPDAVVQIREHLNYHASKSISHSKSVQTLDVERPDTSEAKAEWIDTEIANSLDAGVFSDPADPELLAYCERGWEREQREQER